jgi:hypothetical protein
MPSFDYTTADRSRELIPHGTVAALELKIKAGDAGEDGLLTRSADGQAEMLSAEFTVVDEGEHARRKLWERFVLSGTTKGHAKAGEISRSRLREILESARGILPTDISEAARAKRTVTLRDFDGMRFIGKIGVERGSNSGGKNYPDRNVLLGAITPDRAGWRQVEQIEKPAEPAAPTAAVIVGQKPAWAK